MKKRRGRGRPPDATEAEREGRLLIDIRNEIEGKMEIAWKIARNHFPIGGARAAFMNVARMIAYRDRGIRHR